MPTGAMGSNLRACSLCAEYFAPDADSTRDMISDGVTSDFLHIISDQRRDVNVKDDRPRCVH